MLQLLRFRKAEIYPTFRHFDLLKILNSRTEHTHIVSAVNILVKSVADTLGVTHFTEYSSVG